MLALDIIGGILKDQVTYEDEYRGNTYQYIQYHILAAQDQFGYEMILDDPPHLHTKARGTVRPDRLISIGCDPSSYYYQWVEAVAIPSDAEVTSVHDYQPYRHIQIGDWDIFYYDISNIHSHVSIHITYVPTGDGLPLYWAEVEANR